MRVLLVTRLFHEADEIRQALAATAAADTSVDVCAPDDATHWLAEHPETRIVLLLPDVLTRPDGPPLQATVRAVSSQVVVVALTPRDDERAEAHATIAGADAVIPADEATTPRFLERLRALTPRAGRPDTRDWRLLFAGRDTDLRRAVAQALGPRIVLMNLSADGRLVPIIDWPGAATALVVDAREDEAGMLLGLRRIQRLHPALPVVTICAPTAHRAFLGEGVDACATPDVDVSGLIGIVARAAETRLAAAELLSLRAREARLRAVVEHLPAAVLMVGPDGLVSAVNLAGLDVLKTPDSRDVIGHPLGEWLTLDGVAIGAFVSGVAAGQAAEARAAGRRPDMPALVQVRAAPFQREAGQPTAVLLSLHTATADIAPSVVPVELPVATPVISREELDETRAALDASTTRLAGLEADHDGRVQTELDLRAQVASLERERDDLRRDVHELRHVRDEIPVWQAAQARLVVLDGALAEAQEARAQSLALETDIEELRAASGRVLDLEAALADAHADADRLRERPATLQAHVDEETRWLLYEVASIGHLTTTPDAAILSANDIAARLLGHFSGDALQASGQLPAPILRAAGAFDQRPTRFEVCLQHGDDGPLHWLVGLATPHAGVPATVTWMLLDVTEQRLQGGRTRFLRRMDGLTHVLSAASAESTTLVGRAVPLLDAAADTLGTREDLDITGTRTSLARTQAVLTQLSGYARRRARRETVHDLRAIIDTASAVLVHLAGEDITCTISHGDEPLHATLEPAEFQPLLTSLVMAGREALPLGGHLSLTTRAVNTDAGNDGTFFMRPSIEMTLLAEGYGAQRPEGLQPLEESASRQGGTLVTTADDRNEVRWVLRLARVFVTP